MSHAIQSSSPSPAQASARLGNLKLQKRWHFFTLRAPPPIALTPPGLEQEGAEEGKEPKWFNEFAGAAEICMAGVQTLTLSPMSTPVPSSIPPTPAGTSDPAWPTGSQGPPPPHLSLWGSHGTEKAVLLGIAQSRGLYS